MACAPAVVPLEDRNELLGTFEQIGAHDNAVHARSQAQTPDVPFCRSYQPSDERTEQRWPQALRLGMTQAQHQHQWISRRSLEPVVLVKQLGALVQSMHEQGANARVLRNVHRTADGILQQ